MKDITAITRPLTMQVHLGNPKMARIPELTIQSMPECEGGGWYMPADQAETIVKIWNGFIDNSPDQRAPLPTWAQLVAYWKDRAGKAEEPPPMTDPTPQTTPTRDEAAELARLTHFHRNEIGHYTGFDFVHRLERHFAALASAPAPASGGVEAVRPEDQAEAFIQAAIDSAPESLRRLGEWLANKLDDDDWKTADRLITGAAVSCASLSAELDQAAGVIKDRNAELASLSPAATPGSEAEPVATVRTIRPLMCEAVIDFIPKQNGHLPFDVGSKLYALAKHASSPADGADAGAPTWGDTGPIPGHHFGDEFEPAPRTSSPAGAQEALRALYEWYDRDGSVGGASEVFEKHRSSLSQSTSAGRVGE